MDIAYFIQQLVNGLTTGSAYALIAIGYTMVYGIIGMINFAHGEIYMISAYIGFLVLAVLMWMGIDSVLLLTAAALLISIILTSVYGYSVERVAYRPLRSQPRLIALISAIGMSIFLQNFVAVGQTNRDVAIPTMVSERWTLNENAVTLSEKTQSQTTLTSGQFAQFENEFFECVADECLRADLNPTNKNWVAVEEPRSFEVGVSAMQVIIWAATIMSMLGLTYFITRTKLGRACRACAEDMGMAKLLGIATDKVISLTFVIGATLAAVAGVFLSMYYGSINPYIGLIAGLKAFTAAVLGGIGSIPGAVLGGLILGVSEAMTAGYLSPEYKDVMSFGLLIIILLVRPSGLLGKPEVEKV